MSTSQIILSTINARYIHASLGLRYLLANMGELKASTMLAEFTLQQRPEDIAEQLLAKCPSIIGLGVYIWNVEHCTQVVSLIKTIRPEVKIVLGGPEVSYETTMQPIVKMADHVISGQADFAFAELCQDLIHEEATSKLISPLPFDIKTLVLPYGEYSDEDLRQRVIYVEASRGCPFKCEFCLSSLDKTATAFDLQKLLEQLEQLLERGARQFKFVDRTFNLKVDTSLRILNFFLKHIDKELFLHFELIPDRLPDPLKALIPKFPPGSLQFEIGIQSFNKSVQERISRKQQHDKTCANLAWLRHETHAHVHADLIFGLPGEDLQSFGRGFDELYHLGPQEIQVGILKRLRGTPICRHTDPFDMRYTSTPPYRILSNSVCDFNTVQRMVRFARYWDLVANSGRFSHTLPLLLGDSPFDRFMLFSDWLFETTRQTHKIALPKLFSYLQDAMITQLQIPAKAARKSLIEDYHANRLKGSPDKVLGTVTTPEQAAASGKQSHGNRRQKQHHREADARNC